MRVAQVTSWLGPRGGGVPAIVLPLARVLASRGLDVAVLGLRDGADLNRDGGLAVLGPGGFGFTPALAGRLRDLQPDLVHLHGIWMYPSVAVWRWSAATCRPRIISPQGMLDPWALQRSAWKKRLAMMAYERSNLDGAACIHVLSASEAAAVRALGVCAPLAIVPNGVDLPTVERSASNGGRRTLLFLGRIHPKKGIAELLHAWAAACRCPSAGDWHLNIVGWDDGGHLPALRRQVEELHIEARVTFQGPKYGKEKTEALTQADAFILPSFSEGMPIAVLEAWSHGLPVLMTRECNILEGFASGAAIEVSTDPKKMRESLMALYQMSDAERCAMGAAGRLMVERRFTWDRVASSMLEVYSWVLGGGSPPPCVLLD